MRIPASPAAARRRPRPLTTGLAAGLAAVAALFLAPPAHAAPLAAHASPTAVHASPTAVHASPTAVHAAPLAATAATQVRKVVRQRITVTARSRTTTFATFRAYRWSGRRWIRVFGPWTARVGYNGVARPGRKREGDGKTPSGTFGFSFFFGVDRNPGVHFGYRHAYTYDYWDDDPRSRRYNLWTDIRHANAGRDPEPMHNVPAYDYAAVIAYNIRRVPGRGSAVFLHEGTGGPTAGCVSLPKRKLLKVLRWLRPADHPKITITAR